MRRRPFFLSLATLLALVLGILISAMLFAALRHLGHDKVNLDFQQQARVRVAAVQNGLNNSIDVLKDVNQLFAAFSTVSREEFHSFSAPLLARNPYIQALNFHRIVSLNERPEYEAAMRLQYPDFTINDISKGYPVRSGERDHYRVVEYIEPMHGNEAALGADADSYSFQQAAMQRAIDTGQPSATGLLRLTQEKEKQKGIIVLMPVYRNGAPLTDIAARRQAVIGDTAAVFRGADLIARSLAAEGFMLISSLDRDINISVYASEKPAEENLLFRKGSRPEAVHSSVGFPDWLFYNQPGPYRHEFDVAGQTWHMVVSTPPTWFMKSDAVALWAFLAGLLFSIGGAVYLQTVLDRSRRIQLVVDERTAQLRLANEELNADIAARKRTEHELQLRERAIQASPNSIIITSAVAPHYAIEYVNPAFERITGYSVAEAIGLDLCFLWGHDIDQPGIEEIRATAIEEREGHAVLRNYRKDGTLFWSDMYIAPVKDDSGAVSHFIVVQYDITATKRYESELEFQTNRDALTGLANRGLLRDRLGQHNSRRPALPGVAGA